MRVPVKNWLEWTVFVIGLFCIGAVVAYLAADALRSAHGGAEVIVRLGEPERRDGRRYVPVTVVNSGGTAADAVQVEVVLERGERLVERAVLLVDLIPRNASREGWVAFDSAAVPGDRIRAGGVAFGQP